jgi:hypothetical protein
LLKPAFKKGWLEFIQLDLKKVSVFGDKKSAKYAAVELGLKTWRYVKL